MAGCLRRICDNAHSVFTDFNHIVQRAFIYNNLSNVRLIQLFPIYSIFHRNLNLMAVCLNKMWPSLAIFHTEVDVKKCPLKYVEIGKYTMCIITDYL